MKTIDSSVAHFAPKSGCPRNKEAAAAHFDYSEAGLTQDLYCFLISLKFSWVTFSPVRAWCSTAMK